MLESLARILSSILARPTDSFCKFVANIAVVKNTKIVVGQGGSDIGFRWPPHSLLKFSDEHETVSNVVVQLFRVGVAKLLEEGAEERCATGSSVHSERTSCVSHFFTRRIRLSNLVAFEPGAPGSLGHPLRISAVSRTCVYCTGSGGPSRLRALDAPLGRPG